MSGKLGYIDGVLAIRHPKPVHVLKGKYISQVNLGEQMTIIATSSSPQKAGSLQIKVN